jgi:hypothetical protein
VLSVGKSESNRIIELEMLVCEARAELAVTAEKLAATTKQLEATRSERDRLRISYQRLFEQVELLRRRIYAAKPNASIRSLELEFKAKDKLDKMATELGKLDEDGEVQQSERQRTSASDAEVGNRPAGKPKQARPKPRDGETLTTPICRKIESRSWTLFSRAEQSASVGKKAVS